MAGPQRSCAALRETFAQLPLADGGYFVCGFQVVFIGVHMPSPEGPRADGGHHGLAPGVPVARLQALGPFGHRRHLCRPRGQTRLVRTLVAIVLALRRSRPGSVYVFAAAMGLLWLSTVPPTNAVVAQIFGVQYMSMLRRLRLPQPPGRVVHGRLAGRPAV